MPMTFRLISKQTLGSNTATLTFNNIPGIYSDLMLYISARSTKTSSGNWADIRLRPNAATTNMSMRMFFGNGSSVASASYTDYIYFWVTSNAATSNVFGSTSIYIPNYAGSTNKSVSVDSVSEHNGASSLIVAGAGLWSSTDAITSLVIEQTGGDIVAGSSFYLYGITKF